MYAAPPRTPTQKYVLSGRSPEPDSVYVVFGLNANMAAWKVVPTVDVPLSVMLPSAFAVNLTPSLVAVAGFTHRFCLVLP